MCLPWNGEKDPASELRTGNRATVSGWGKVTNDPKTNRKNLEEFHASTRFSSIDHLKSDCSFLPQESQTQNPLSGHISRKLVLAGRILKEDTQIKYNISNITLKYDAYRGPHKQYWRAACLIPLV